MTGFTIYYGGGEQPGWRKMLAEVDAPMMISFKGLVRRLPKTKPYTIAERFPDGARLFLDSGAHAFNREPDKHTVGDLEAYAARYEEFVQANVDAVEMVSEFDCQALGPAWVATRRREFYDHLDPRKFMPVWHPEEGEPTLRALGEAYDVVGVTATSVGGRDLTQSLNVVARSGVRLHGIAMTKPDDLRSVDFASAASTSWLSPMKYGDTIIWDGQQLHRYPKDYKDRSRRQHAMLIAREGFDVDKIMADEPNEVVRLALWSWQQFAATVSQRKSLGRPAVNPFSAVPDAPESLVSTTSGQVIHAEFGQGEGGETTTTPSGGLNSGQLETTSGPPAPALPRAARRNLPVLGFETVTSTFIDADGVEQTTSEVLTRSTINSARVCDNCYLAHRCPLMAPGAECAFDIPVEVKTAEQAQALRQGLIEMQAKRVAVLQFGEDLNGGMADPNLSTELDRLWKHMAQKAEIEDDRTSIDFSIKAKGQASTLERIFGREAPPLPGQEPGYMDAAAVNREMARVIDGDTL